MMIVKGSLAIVFLLPALLFCAHDAQSGEFPHIARWSQNYDAAVSFRFDDTLESHIKTVVPLLNRYGFKATFMVSPGISRYKDHREFWERQLPQMGHRLGNHTMSHNGARDVTEAGYQIGEAARIIRDAYPWQSKLLVFASGGGKKWGEKEWEQANPEYIQLVDKYHLIDLYDGHHPAVGVNAESRIADLCGSLDKTADTRRHQAAVFHHVGDPSIIDRIKGIVRGHDMTTREETLSAFLQCISKRRDRLWIAPLLDVLMYEEEYRGATLTVLRSYTKTMSLALFVQTDPALYNQKLTLVLPLEKGQRTKRVLQNGEDLQVYQRVKGESLVDVKPVNSTIMVHLD